MFDLDTQFVLVKVTLCGIEFECTTLWTYCIGESSSEVKN